MPKKDIHPKQHKVTVEMSNGEKFEMITSWGKEGDILKLDVDPKNHPAWQKEGKQSFLNTNDNQISKFNKKYGNFDI